MSTLDVTLVQADLHWHDPEKNLREFSRTLQQVDGRTDLVVLPEMFSTGFTMEAEAHAERMDGQSVAWMTETAKQTGAVICGSLVIRDDGRYFNRFLLMRPDGNFDFYDKRHLFRLAGEHEHYSPGTHLVTFRIGEWRVRPMVCYDLRFPAWSRNRNDYDLLVYTANWPEPRHHAWATLIQARAIENLSYVAAVNRVGTDGNGIRYAGGSAVVDYLGHHLTPVTDAPGVWSATLDLGKLKAFREKFPFHVDADRFELETVAP
ncbi:MAG TPA: amidohydrolase [Woeseiaceae bacterium]|nr:amidohydrolase [Woeseiaceae bacterium]